MTTVIRAENLGKKYLIRHEQQGQRFRYDSLSESLANGGKAFCNRLLHPFSARHKMNAKEEFWALMDINFEIQQGDRVGIIGRNGAGKSTLLKILSRITKPTTGKVHIKGRVASLLEVGTGFHPELTGRENIFLNGAILGMLKAEIKRKFDEIVDFAEVEKFLDTPVKHYSSGMYVRLAFAVAAHLEPEILLIDEVLAVGDSEFRKKCLGKMEDVSQNGRTVLFVSHDMGSISNLCLKTIWIESGIFKAFDDSQKVIKQFISSSKSLAGEISWDDMGLAPGNEYVRLKAVRIISDGVTTADVMIDKEIRIEIDYFNLVEENVLVANMHLRDKMNAYVLASANLQSVCLNIDPWSVLPRPKGLYRTVCTIPANFLNNDSYSIDIAILNLMLEWQAWAKNVLSFVVHESGAMKKEYMGSWVGVVRPKLAWQTHALRYND